MPIIHLALPAEAKTLRNRLGLKKIRSIRKMEIFQKENLSLVVSGVGKVNTAVAIASVSSLYPQSSDYYLNLGICGSCRSDQLVGEAFMVSKCTDIGTGRSYYPDLISSSPWKSASIASFDKPVIGIAPDGYDLVDMEASAFFQSAIYFAESHRIHSVKIVSDHLEGNFCKAEDIESWMDKNMDSIISWLEFQSNPTKDLDSSIELAQNIHTIVDSIAKNLRLTATQTFTLQNVIESWSFRNIEYSRKPSDSWKQFLYKQSDFPNKSESKSRLKSIMQFFQNE
ncbi:5'-methylthioadenosine/S-adenosylhomocysteine nucleosidase family protein [Leptospira sp. GIMC2001]|uniref:5'-methylthioadenosine/S-adenosylhomocysteine nucleosidase family protein n=1 Tax=Leptospira sp. GIMC2001 TaxID=1513297 RepID=UPI00234AE0EC|nr:hypothetical protein [Leptospira sp. GIMC2001]WCL49867.1 hypothetical protein O4O04_03350 [Leptospira sp. GIMC2001]